MWRHALTPLVVIVCAVVLTLLFTSRSGYKARIDPRADIAEAETAIKDCWDPLISLTHEIAGHVDDPDRFASMLVPPINRCKAAEAAIGIAHQRHPHDPAVGKLREKLGISQTWLNDLAKAIAAYKAAKERGSASKELDALRALLQ